MRFLPSPQTNGNAAFLLLTLLCGINLIDGLIGLATTTDALIVSPSTASARRTFLWGGCAAAAGLCSMIPMQPAHAIPLVSTDEFNIILRDSANSVAMVEFSGPRSETVTVQLVDGTQFGIRDVVESSIDPRSPLKIAAYAKAYQIPVRFTSIEAALGAGRTKKKLYTNSRVLEAAEKEKEKAVRLQQDEELRQAELARLQEVQVE